jgi:hypothetical protein
VDGISVTHKQPEVDAQLLPPTLVRRTVLPVTTEAVAPVRRLAD